MRAILLAAGRGKRLGIDGPKCLVEIAGKTLLERHLEAMPKAGITALTIVVGFKHEMIETALAKIGSSLPIDLVLNERFTEGSILSLQVAEHRLEDGGIWMDADVIYPPELLTTLVASTHENCVLLDGRSEESGEEMMVGVKDGRARTIARRVGKDWDFAGESVGFAKVGKAGAAVMKRLLDAEVAAGRTNQEYEAAMNLAFGEIAFGYERVDTFAWTEMDFQEDVEKATRIAKSL